MHVLLLNVKYSANLGDGLLSECLEAELARQPGVAGVTSLDLAGREAYGDGWRNRRVALALLERLPNMIRRFVTGVALRRMARRTLRPRCRAAMGQADAVVLGGGNLLADADLNFPIKIACALGEAAHAGRPVGVFGVGVSDNWSRRGAALLGGAIGRARPVHGAVRDTRSKAIWDRRLRTRGVPAASLCRDPGLLTARHFRAAAPVSGRIGLCLTDPLALRYHGAAGADARLDGWIVDLAGGLAARGHEIAVFTNGSPEDRAYLAAMTPRLRAACGDRLTIVPAFATPAGLATFASGCALLIAHRMHACIAAYSYAVPHLGLAWDAKLDSFFASVGREAYMIDPATTSPAEAAVIAERALGDGIDGATHQAVLNEAAADVARLHDALRTAVAA